MAIMGMYCKAYLLAQLRGFDGWSEYPVNARRERREGDEGDVSRKLADDSIVYLQENYVVTDDIFMNGNVLFDDVTPEWIEYCKGVLGFEIPADVLDEAAPSRGDTPSSK